MFILLNIGFYKLKRGLNKNAQKIINTCYFVILFMRF